MAVVGVGIDLVDLARLERILVSSRGERFTRRICTDRERAVCDSRVRPAEAYGARFAAKEAFFKALGAPTGLRWHEIEVVREEGGRPALEVTGRAAELLDEREVGRLHLSLTHDGGMAAAVVVLEE